MPLLFFQRIVSLETLREKNSQQLLAKDQEIASLRQQLRSAQGEVVASLHTQLDEKKREAEQREKLFQSLTLETENLKNRLASVTERCQALEKRDPSAQVREATSSCKLVFFVCLAMAS